MNLDPPASPLHKIFVYYLHFESETSHFTVISSFIIVIGLNLWKCFKGDIWEMDVVLEVPFLLCPEAMPV